MNIDSTLKLPYPIVAVLERFGVDASYPQPLFRGQSILYLPIAGSIAIDVWTALRAVVDDAQMWPVLLGDEQSIRLHQDDAERKVQLVVAQILADSLTTDTTTWNKEQTERMRRWLESSGRSMDYMDADSEGIHSDWPDELEPNNHFSVPYDWRTKEPLATISMGFVPTVLSWQVPAFLRFGDWNATPSPAVHAAQLRAWEQQYGAEVVALTHDTIEMRVARPPDTREAALTLAHEQYAYCPDIVDQGVGSIEELAAMLLHGTVWYFWWD